eukprot:UN10987
MIKSVILEAYMNNKRHVGVGLNDYSYIDFQYPNLKFEKVYIFTENLLA